jgi:hypothetical protein
MTIHPQPDLTKARRLARQLLKALEPAPPLGPPRTLKPDDPATLRVEKVKNLNRQARSIRLEAKRLSMKG